LLNLTAPVRVAVIDAAGPLADLDCGRVEQPPYTAAWILVCRACLARAEFPGMSAEFVRAPQ
jgi:hypothetical protein